MSSDTCFKLVFDVLVHLVDRFRFVHQANRIGRMFFPDLAHPFRQFRHFAFELKNQIMEEIVQVVLR